MFELKVAEELCVMTLKGDAIFKEELTGGLKNEVRNLVNFHASSCKSEHLYFDKLLLSIANKVSTMNSTEELSLMTQNFEKKLTFCLKNDMKNLVNFNESIGKV